MAASLKLTPVHEDGVAPHIVFGTIATGDVFVASEERKQAIRELAGADAVEARGCWASRLDFAT